MVRKILCIAILFSISSCSNIRKNEKVSNDLTGEIIRVDLNYYQNDSLQKLIGFYPAKIYFSLGIINKSDQKLFLPLIERIENQFNSTIVGVINQDTLVLYQINDANKNFINPKDTLYVLASLSINNKNGFESMIEQMKYMSNNLKLIYIPKEESFKIPNRIKEPFSFYRQKGFNIIYRDSLDDSQHEWY